MQNNQISRGAITAAGLGTRAYPGTACAPKPMFEVDGKPILQAIIELFRDKLKIKDIYIVINYLGGSIKKYFGTGAAYGVRITYLINDSMERGLLGSVCVAAQHIGEPFVCILGDEVYLDSNHEKLRSFMSKKKDFDVICAVLPTKDRGLIKKNYSVTTRGDRIIAVKEKPKRVVNNLLGCGTYVFNTNFLNYLEKFTDKNLADAPALMNIIGKFAKNKKMVYAFRLKGDYVNVNTAQDLGRANLLTQHRRPARGNVRIKQ